MDPGQSTTALAVAAAAMGTAAVCCGCERAAALRELAIEQEAHAVTKANRKQEKAGRSKAEREKRELLRANNTKQGGSEYPIVPIGYARSCFLDCSGTPRQPGLCPDTRIRLEFDTRLSPDIFDGLAAHSHVWIVYIFHKNTNSGRTLAHLPSGQTFPAKVKPPRRRGAEHAKLGVLATRTPHRPNPIGLSLGALVKLEAGKRSIDIGGTDLVDGTPIIDIKPYLPNFDSRPLAPGLSQSKWLDEVTPAFCPQWSLDQDPLRSVLITPQAKRAWVQCARRLRIYRKQPELGLSAIFQVLATDCNRPPRPNLPYIMRWDGVLVAYIIADDAGHTTTINGVAPDTSDCSKPEGESGRGELEVIVARTMASLANGKPAT